MSVMDTISTQMTNIVPINVTSTSSIICHSEKVRCKIGCYILCTVLLVIILQLIIAVICYHYAKHRLKQKGIHLLTI